LIPSLHVALTPDASSATLPAHPYHALQTPCLTFRAPHLYTAGNHFQQAIAQKFRPDHTDFNDQLLQSVPADETLTADEG